MPAEDSGAGPDAFLPEQSLSPEAIFAAGDQARVPLLVGWNSEESSWRALLRDQEPTPQHYAAAVRSTFGQDADSVLHYFPGETREQVMASATVLAGARFTVFSTRKWAALQHRTAHPPADRYCSAHPQPPARAPSARAGRSQHGPSRRSRAARPPRRR